MKQNSLPAFHITKTTRIVVEADHPLATDLQVYAEFYARNHDAKVTEADLIREMARHYMANDSAFQVFRSKRRRKRRGVVSAPTEDA